IRSQYLPHGAEVPERLLDDEIGLLQAAVREARQSPRKMVLGDCARAAWAAVYPSLSDAKPGLLGNVIGRGEAQVMRLALIYAIPDQAEKIDMPHLIAALAIWEYAEQSARAVFGDMLGDPVADDILAALRGTPDGLSRTEISKVFSNN